MGVSLWKRLWGYDASQDECEFTVKGGKSPLEGNTRRGVHPAWLGLGRLHSVKAPILGCAQTAEIQTDARKERRKSRKQDLREKLK